MSKKIHDLSDDEFDDLFRQSAEKTQIGFDPEAWNKMSQKLEAAAKPEPGKPEGGVSLMKWGLPLGIVLFLLISGIYFVTKDQKETAKKAIENEKPNELTNTKNSHEKNIKAEKATLESKTKLVNPAVSQKSSEKQTLPETETSRSSALSEARAEKSKKQIASINGDKKPDFQTKIVSNRKTRVSAIESTRTQTSFTNSGKRKQVEKESIPQEYPLSNFPAYNKKRKLNKMVATNPESPAQAPDSSIVYKRSQWATVQALSQHKSMVNIQFFLPEIDYAPIVSATPTGVNRNTAFRRGFNIRLALSPDLSFVPSNHIDKIGNNWAALLEYRFNNRLIVQTGVIRSLKQYNAYPNQYEWAGYLSSQSPLKDIDATCKMLDIPLNLRYDITTQSNGRWFAGAGLTSYIMLKETYRYNYENPADPNINRTGWQGKTGSYMFGVLNLSAGYERQIFRRITLQAEPVFKAPLAKVGYGKVRLATAGIFFSVKYPL